MQKSLTDPSGGNFVAFLRPIIAIKAQIPKGAKLPEEDQPDEAVRRVSRNICAGTDVLQSAIYEYNQFSNIEFRRTAEQGLIAYLEQTIAVETERLNGDGTAQNRGLRAIANEFYAQIGAAEDELNALRDRLTLTIAEEANLEGQQDQIPAARRNEITNLRGQMIRVEQRIASLRRQLAGPHAAREEARRILGVATANRQNISAGITAMLDDRRSLILFVQPDLVSQLRLPAPEALREFQTMQQKLDIASARRSASQPVAPLLAKLR